MTSTDRLRDALVKIEALIDEGDDYGCQKYNLADAVGIAREALAAAEAPPSRIEVTEEMVEAGAIGLARYNYSGGDKSFIQLGGWPESYNKAARTYAKNRARAALEAALHQKENENGARAKAKSNAEADLKKE